MASVKQATVLKHQSNLGEGIEEVAFAAREPVTILKEWQQVRHKFCFSLQLMHTRVHGIALSRASAIGSPQSRHMP